jgi:transcription antitermination protein NusB
MLNRRHIRIKVMQALYAYYCCGTEVNREHIMKEMRNNLHRLYQLYLYMLVFLNELTLFAERYDSDTRARLIPSGREKTLNSRLYNNLLIEKLRNNETFITLCEKNALIWDMENNNLLRKVFMDLKNAEEYQEYINGDKDDINLDIAMLEYILKHYPYYFSILEQHFEDKYINWFDDAKLAIQMAQKTIRNVGEDKENTEKIFVLGKDDRERLDFAEELFLQVTDNDSEYDTMIREKVEKWEPSRLALLDVIILKIGLSEFLGFPDIPVRVTINECIELAKNYSIPNSRKFINGMLDKLLDELQKEGKITKNSVENSKHKKNVHDES